MSEEPSLWDEWKDDEEWIVLRSTVSSEALTVRFSAPAPSAAELSSLRRIAEEVAALPLAELGQRVGNTGTFALGQFGPAEADAVVQAAEREGLAVSRAPRRRTDLLPFHRASRMVCLLEDEEEAREVCRAMIAAGRAVQEQEVD